MNQKAMRSYCLSRQALDFTASLPELFLLLAEQHGRAEELEAWLASRVQAQVG
jgi:hypothetical protein